MGSTLIAFGLISPFALVFGYAALHEIARRHSDNGSHYGLAYDPETDSTHLTLLAEGEDGVRPGDNHAETHAAGHGNETARRAPRRTTSSPAGARDRQDRTNE